METFCEKIHGGNWKGYSGKKIKNIINIGIGGSNLGPKMIVEALTPFHIKDIEVRFVSNVDAAHFQRQLRYTHRGGNPHC